MKIDLRLLQYLEHDREWELLIFLEASLKKPKNFSEELHVPCTLDLETFLCDFLELTAVAGPDCERSRGWQTTPKFNLSRKGYTFCLIPIMVFPGRMKI